MAYVYDKHFADLDFQAVGAGGLSLALNQSVLSITETPHGEPPMVRRIARRQDSTYSCARADEDGKPLPKDACQSLFHAARLGNVCSHIKNLRDGERGTFYKW